MTIRLQFDQMKMLYSIPVEKPANFQALQTLAFDKAWECVTEYFKSCEEPLPKQKHGKPSSACITDETGKGIDSDQAFQAALKKTDTFLVRFKVPAHPAVPFVPFHG